MSLKRDRKKKRKEKYTQDKLARLKRKTRMLLSQDIEFDPTPENEAKISSMLVELVEPYHSSLQTLEQYRALLMVGTFAWNSSSLPDTQQQELINEFMQEIESFSLAIRNDLVSLMQNLIVRKRMLFPEYRRLIISFDVQSAQQGYFVSVTSSEMGFEDDAF